MSLQSANVRRPTDPNESEDKLNDKQQEFVDDRIRVMMRQHKRFFKKGVERR